MNLTQFADLWRGMFYLASTLIMGALLYLLIIVWQPLWKEGFDDFGQISKSIENLDATTKPAVELVPNMLAQMTLMNENMQEMSLNMREMSKNMELMNQNMTLMNGNVSRMQDVLSRQMETMTYQIDRMNEKMSPKGMMPFNW